MTNLTALKQQERVNYIKHWSCVKWKQQRSSTTNVTFMPSVELTRSLMAVIWLLWKWMAISSNIPPNDARTPLILHTAQRYTPQQLHWLSVPERVTFKLCIMVYRCLHGIGPEYFSEDLRLVSEIYSRQRLRLASSTNVVVPATRRSSLGNWAFPVAEARAWNALPPSVTSAPSLSSFRRLLKTFLFQRQRRQ